MKPDAYMPFYGNDFFGAVQAWDNDTQLAYLRLIWYYWNHSHCNGLENNSEVLRRIAKIDKENWAQVESLIFDNSEFFTQDANFLWHQKRAYEEWAKALTSYETAVRNGKKGGYHAHKGRNA